MEQLTLESLDADVTEGFETVGKTVGNVVFWTAVGVTLGVIAFAGVLYLNKQMKEQQKESKS